VSPNAATDYRRNAKHDTSKLDSLRYNEQKFLDLVDSQDAEIVRVHEKNMRDIRAQRAAHLKALDNRQRIEKRRLHWPQ
jgi:predicted double-glycine peptidase